MRWLGWLSVATPERPGSDQQPADGLRLRRDTGILIEQAGATVQNSVANVNGSYGIYAAEGTVDGGGNTASGNGDGTNPQCVNVSCGVP